MASTESARNQPSPLDLGYVCDTRVNPSATRRRAATLGKRRSIKKDWQAAWLLRAVTCIDLTTLAGDDTPGNVARLAAKARQPVRQDLLDALGVGEAGITVGAVCVYHARVADAVAALQGHVDPGGGGFDRLPGRAKPLPAAHRRDPRVGRGGRGRDRHRDLTRARPARELAGALRRGVRDAPDLRRRPHEDHPRHRRAGSAVERGDGEQGLHAGRGGLHQDLHRQGSGQRHPGSRPGDDPRHPRVLSSGPATGSGSSPPAASARPRKPSNG